jgi:hypothetical protein
VHKAQCAKSIEPAEQVIVELLRRFALSPAVTQAAIEIKFLQSLGAGQGNIRLEFFCQVGAPVRFGFVPATGILWIVLPVK